MANRTATGKGKPTIWHWQARSGEAGADGLFRDAPRGQAFAAVSLTCALRLPPFLGRVLLMRRHGDATEQVLCVVDDCTRENLSLVADTSLSGQRVVRELPRGIAASAAMFCHHRATPVTSCRKGNPRQLFFARSAWPTLDRTRPCD